MNEKKKITLAEYDEATLTTTVLVSELERLQDCANELACLEYAGVDNWVGYEFLAESLKENFPETYARKYGME